ncbi:OmpH family outer membrane protein [Cognatishimia sp. F0-27]|uniref:OmpH family outer membrane protein n=1 Tax=Cognatishimia sp. F0-27 TaxID=2816855 RepID=UPI001D0C088C|nr:OmpH family outer membrane protein [Cognatishimia sp. F0-27]
MAGTLSEGTVQSPILVIEFDRAFAQSAFGQRVLVEIEAEGASLAAENRRIEAELTEEERRLTDERAGMEPDEFRALARAFDEKVQRLRREQDIKARALNQRSEDARRQFLAVSEPVLQSLMRESGAAVILERRAVFLAANFIDVTDQAVDRIDNQIGDGADLTPMAQPEPEPDNSGLPAFETPPDEQE